MKIQYLTSLLLAIFSAFNVSKAQFTIYNSSNSGLTDNYCWYVNESSNGDVWVSGANNGAFKKSGAIWQNYTNSNIGGNYCTAIAFDSSGNTWIGTDDFGGVAKFDGTNWTQYNMSNSGLPNNQVLCIVADNEKVWIGTRNGLARYNGSSWTIYNTNNSAIPSNVIYSLAKDTLGNIWVGTPYNGAAKFNGTTWTTYATFNSGLPDNDVYSIKYNKLDNSMWFGTAYGIGVLKNGIWSTYNTNNTIGFPGNYVRGILHSELTGKTYLASGNGGIGEFNGTTWKTYNSSNSNLPINSVWTINSAQNGNVWASLFGGGVVQFSDSIQGQDSCKRVVFSNDFSSNTGWNFNTTSNVNIGNGQLNFNNVQNGQYNSVYRSLGAVLSDSYWKSELKYTISQNPANSGTGGYVVALTAGNQDFMSQLQNGNYTETNQDGIAVVCYSDPYDDNTNNWVFLMEDKKGNSRNWDLNTAINMNAAISSYYLRFERLNTGTLKLSVFSDSLFINHISGSPKTYNINSTITGLNTIQHGASTPGWFSRILNAKIDNDYVCDNNENYSVSLVSDYDAAIGFHDGNPMNTASLNFGGAIQNAAYAVPSFFGQGLNVNRALIHFDLSSIPSNATITSAKLDLYSISQIGSFPAHSGSNNNVLVERALTPWTEYGVTWNNQPQTTSLNAQTLVGTNNPNQDYLDIDITAMINDMRAANANHGIKLRLASQIATNLLSFCSMNYPDSSKHPKLKISYTLNNSLGSIENPKVINETLNIFPNPASTSITLQYNFKDKNNVLFNIYNGNGELVLRTKLDPSDKTPQINLEGINNGVYFGSLTADGIVISTKKIVVIH